MGCQERCPPVFDVLNLKQKEIPDGENSRKRNNVFEDVCLKDWDGLRPTVGSASWLSCKQIMGNVKHFCYDAWLSIKDRSILVTDGPNLRGHRGRGLSGVKTRLTWQLGEQRTARSPSHVTPTGWWPVWRVEKEDSRMSWEQGVTYFPLHCPPFLEKVNSEHTPWVKCPAVGLECFPFLPGGELFMASAATPRRSNCRSKRSSDPCWEFTRETAGKVESEDDIFSWHMEEGTEKKKKRWWWWGFFAIWRKNKERNELLVIALSIVGSEQVSLVGC